MSARATRIIGLAAAFSVVATATPALAQDLSETRRIEVARRLQESSVFVSAGPQGGSGFVVSDEHWIATNAHVAEGAQYGGLRIRFADGRAMRARVLAVDAAHDLALLVADGQVTARALLLANSDQVQVGQAVLAFGSPFGLEGTLTQGIVSARRDLPGTGGAIRGVIQTDAPINPGNSGGPLVNSRGEVIGINTAILSRTGGSQGIGFAVPANYIRELVARVRSEVRTGRAPQQQPSRGEPSAQLIPMPNGGATSPMRPPQQPQQQPLGRVWLGIYGDDFVAGNVAGVRVQQVVPGGPAHQAGLLGAADPPPSLVRQLGIPWTGHIILAIDGRRVRTLQELHRTLDRHRPGRAVVTVTVGPGLVQGETVVDLRTPPASVQPRRRR